MYLTKSLKNFDSVLKKENNDKFVLAALSIPLVNKLSNFERLQFHYVPQSMKEFDESNLIAKEDLLDTAKMLQEAQDFHNATQEYHNKRMKNKEALI